MIRRLPASLAVRTARDGLRRRLLLLVCCVTLAAGLAVAGCSEPTPTPDEASSSDDSSSASGAPEGDEEAAPDDDLCPATRKADAIPGVKPEHRTLEYWLERVGAEHDLDEVLLDTPRARALNTVNDHPALGYEPLDEVASGLLLSELQTRLDWLHERVADGRYVALDGKRLEGEELSAFESPTTLPSPSGDVHIALETIQIRCGPRDSGLFTSDDGINEAFDRNNCSSIHAQEPLQIVSDAPAWPNGMRYVRTRYASGWISPDAALSPKVPVDQIEAWTDGARTRVDGGPLEVEVGGETVTLPHGTLLTRVGPGDEDEPASEDEGEEEKSADEGEKEADDTAAGADGQVTVRIATAGGLHEADVDASRLTVQRPLTRRALLEEAFAYLDRPYGWGGQDGGLDCSRFLLDLFEGGFGIRLPRVSVSQSKAGSFSIDLDGVESERERKLLIEAAAERGAVLLQMPGHIMLYLGKNDEGEMMALHSFAEYLVPCPASSADPNPDPKPSKGDHADKGETLFTVNRVDVSDLDLGRGSSRTAFIERLTRITVFGHSPGQALRGAAQVRSAAPVVEPEGRSCSDSQEHAIFFSPAEPNVKQPLRVIVTNSADPGPSSLTLIAPDGTRVEPDSVRELGGAPPFSVVATVNEPQHGTWKAVFGDGERVVACLRTRVHGSPALPKRRILHTWDTNRRWTEAVENLYAAYVESLFDYPVDEDLTWDSFHALLRDPERNIFHDRFGPGTTKEFRFQPDCADLPYFVRAYFAWNMGLPFGFRQCSRGRAGRPPTCNDTLRTTNLEPPKSTEPHEAFEYFMNRKLRNVHSGSGRTAPGDDDTDYYPVALTHRSLTPGTLYADPDGHLMIVAKWVPQGTDEYGMLIAADAQPDGTVGRRRFWRGSFLFTPDTTNVGAGFKAFRPAVVDDETGGLRALDNEELDGDGPFPAYSEMQYDGTKEDFYDRMASLINPRPLDPFAMQTTLVEALDEQVARRVVSVENSVEYVAKNPETIPMPKGYSIFETQGPWESYSTPARDMRLLIAIDAVTGFAERVRRKPERYGIEADEVDEKIAELVEHRNAELAERTFDYTRSDGSTWTLSLKDVVDRTPAFEMSYNPNDCIEIRWAAPRDSDEYSTCDRHAPRAHTKRMESYREWFQNRARPPR